MKNQPPDGYYWDDQLKMFACNEGPIVFLPCPYGEAGDRLWVRETWRISGWGEDPFIIEYKDGVTRAETGQEALNYEEWAEWAERNWINISDELAAKGIEHDENGEYHWARGESPLNWRPSIHLPRWGSRINLEVLSVRVERIQDITEEDAIAEGVPKISVLPVWGDFEAEKSFIKMWDVINSKRGFGWRKNPWVWVIEFRKL